MKRLTEKTVFSGLVMAWFLATCPTTRSPPSRKATTDGVVRAPSAFVMTTGSPPSITATQELVVPRSMPMTLPMMYQSPLSGMDGLERPPSDRWVLREPRAESLAVLAWWGADAREVSSVARTTEEARPSKGPSLHTLPHSIAPRSSLPVCDRASPRGGAGATDGAGPLRSGSVG